MTDHKCLHETDLALLAKDMADVKDMSKETLKIIKGDNGQGLITKVALNKSAIIRQWWAIAVIISGLSGIAFFSLK